MERFKTYRVRMKIRRGPGFNPRPEADALDGKEFVVEVAWLISPDEWAQYGNEYALRPVGEQSIEAFRRAQVQWTASGDVEVLGEVTG
jgi:hypothetical protein